MLILGLVILCAVGLVLAAGPISGDYLTAKANGTTIAGVMGWRVRESVGKLAGQTGQHRGKTANDHGSITATVELQIVQDYTSTPYVPVSAGTTLTELQLFRHIDSNVPAFQFPTFKVFESDNGSAMGDRWVINASGENYGNYTKNDPA